MCTVITCRCVPCRLHAAISRRATWYENMEHVLVAWSWCLIIVWPSWFTVNQFWLVVSCFSILTIPGNYYLIYYLLGDWLMGYNLYNHQPEYDDSFRHDICWWMICQPSLLAWNLPELCCHYDGFVNHINHHCLLTIVIRMIEYFRWRQHHGCSLQNDSDQAG